MKAIQSTDGLEHNHDLQKPRRCLACAKGCSRCRGEGGVDEPWYQPCTCQEWYYAGKESSG